MQTAPSACAPAVLAFLLGFAMPSANAQGTNAPKPEFTPKPLYGEVTPVCPCESLTNLVLANTTIESATVDPADGSCRVTAIVTHPPAGDRVTIWIGLPVKDWNGRFRGTGGGGFLGGSARSLARPIAAGYAAGATDTGHAGGSGKFALDANGRLDWQRIRDNAYLGIHEMTVVGKAITKAFYGKAPGYCYFEGGSTGGRQGLMEAQRYPEDYDGIVSACPAINWHKFLPADLWPQVVMYAASNLVSKVKLEAATAAAIAACDAVDGVTDGVINDPYHCFYDPKALVGTQMRDGDRQVTFTSADAEVILKIWDGPRAPDGTSLWYGLTRGTDLVALAGSGGDPPVGKPFSITLEWFRYFLTQDPNWDGTTLGVQGFEALWRQSVEQYGDIIGTDNPDLTRFRDRGGKVIIYHGLADQLIPAQGSIEYYQRVQQQMGKKTAQFARLFLVPGVDHGFRGTGPSPIGLTAAITQWVEENRPPDKLIAELHNKEGKVVGTRPVFAYPRVTRYKGTGRTDDAANFESRPR